MKANDLNVHGTPDALPCSLQPIDFTIPKIRFATERCRNKRVLDLGCVMHVPEAVNRSDFMHRALAEVASTVVGLDLHEAGVAALRAQGYDVVVGDAENFRFDQPFDVIVAGDIIEHLGNMDDFLTSCLTALKPGGKILIQTPNPWYWRNIAKAILYPEVPNNPEHTCWFDPRTLRQLAERYGLTLGEVAVQFHSSIIERILPLPRGIKHAAWFAELIRSQPPGTPA